MELKSLSITQSSWIAIHSLIQQILIEHIFCARTILGFWKYCSECRPSLSQYSFPPGHFVLLSGIWRTDVVGGGCIFLLFLYNIYSHLIEIQFSKWVRKYKQWENMLLLSTKLRNTKKDHLPKFIWILTTEWGLLQYEDEVITFYYNGSGN